MKGGGGGSPLLTVGKLLDGARNFDLSVCHPQQRCVFLWKLIYDAVKYIITGTLWDRLNPLYVHATKYDPTARCTLPELIEGLQSIPYTHEAGQYGEEEVVHLTKEYLEMLRRLKLLARALIE